MTKLEELKRLRFPLIGKEERIARALVALHQSVTIPLSAEDWHWIIEAEDEEVY